jgi:hypothetical protein
MSNIGALTKVYVDENAIGRLIPLGLLKAANRPLSADIGFQLDPVAEYCAAEYWHEHSNSQEWQTIKEHAKSGLPAYRGKCQH